MPEQEAVETKVSALSFINLPLQNGWLPYGPFTAPPGHAFNVETGYVHLRGAMRTPGTNPAAFILPVGSRPTANVYVPVNLCLANKGRLFIAPTGVVQVQAEGDVWSNAQCFTSLEGVAFAAFTTGSTALTLQNGWTHGPFGTRSARALLVNNTVHLSGAIANGSIPPAFTMPSGMRPTTHVYLPVDMCNATKGRLHIDPAGTATVVAEGSFENARCFTSLEGVSYALNPATPPAFTCFAPQNGWIGAPFGTRGPCARSSGGVVRLLGAVSSGLSQTAFTLPVGMRPPFNTYVEADLFNGKQGRILIQPNGAVTIQPKGSFDDAKLFTSFEGVHFSL
jgi:hypothetical protein